MSLARRRRRLGPGRRSTPPAPLLDGDGAVEVDMIERLPTPWGLVRLGVAPDHPEHQGRLARLREDRAAARVPLLRQRRGRAATLSHDELARALRRGRLHGRRADRPAARDPGRGPARLVAGDRVRRLVQRPPRLPGSRLRPLARAGGRGRERQRRDRRRAHARADRTRSSRRPTRPTRRSRRSSPRGFEEIVMLGRRGPAQAAFTPPELQELGELAGADVVVDPADLELDPASERALEADRATRAPQRRPAARVRGAGARGQAAHAPPALPASRRSRSSATAGSRRSRSCATSSSPASDGQIVAPSRRTSAR